MQLALFLFVCFLQNYINKIIKLHSTYRAPVWQSPTGCFARHTQYLSRRSVCRWGWFCPCSQGPSIHWPSAFGKANLHSMVPLVESTRRHHSVRKAPLDHSCPNHTKEQMKKEQQSSYCKSWTLPSWTSCFLARCPWQKCPLLHLKDGCPRDHRNMAWSPGSESVPASESSHDTEYPRLESPASPRSKSPLSSSSRPAHFKI